MGAVLSTSSKKKVLTSRKRKLKRIFLKMLLIATIASFTCLTVANPHHRTARSTPGSAAICSSAEKAYSSEAGRQVGGRRRGGRRQGALHQGLRGLRRLNRVRQQCGRHQWHGRLLQRIWQVCGHNDL